MHGPKMGFKFMGFSVSMDKSSNLDKIRAALRGLKFCLSLQAWF